MSANTGSTQNLDQGTGDSLCDISSVPVQNQFTVLDSISQEENGGHADVFSSQIQAGQTEWSQVLSSKKRKLRSSNDSNSELLSGMDLSHFKSQSVNEKLDILFVKSNTQTQAVSSIESKLDHCLQLHDKVVHLEQNINSHESRLLLLEYKSIDLEARSRRKNLLFSGFPEARDENCAEKLSNFFLQHLQINNPVVIDRAHRLGAFKHGYNRPIIAAFRDFSDTQLVLGNANKLRNTSYSINRDFPQEITNARKRMWQEFKSLRQQNPHSRVNLVYPAKIVMNGQVIRNAFPRWDAVMQGNRVGNTYDESLVTANQSNVVGNKSVPCDLHSDDTVVLPSTNTNTTDIPQRSTSMSSTSSQETHSSTFVSRRQSRSHSRRNHAPSPCQSASTNAKRGVSDANVPQQRQDQRPTSDQAFRRPWDTSSVNSKQKSTAQKTKTT